MSYTFSKTVDFSFDETIQKVTEALKTEGFGVLTEIDLSGTLKKKLGVDIRKYRILGACNPEFAYKAVQAETEIGAMLPCNVVVQETDDHKIRVSAVDPVASMMGVKNESLADIAGEVRIKLQRVIDNL